MNGRHFQIDGADCELQHTHTAEDNFPKPSDVFPLLVPFFAAIVGHVAVAFRRDRSKELSKITLLLMFLFYQILWKLVRCTYILEA